MQFNLAPGFANTLIQTLPVLESDIGEGSSVFSLTYINK